MDTFDSFKKNLLSRRNAPSKITLKNYMADLRQFSRWIESKGMPFDPKLFTNQIVNEYLEEKTKQSPRSAKRYASTLRKYFTLLREEGKIHHDPFLQQAPKDRVKESDIWHLKEFKNNLYLHNSSAQTIKNYINDIKQFTIWAANNSRFNNIYSSVNILTLINSETLNAYKAYLHDGLQLSPVSINRKLSSLRKYINFAQEKGFLSLDITSLSNVAKDIPLHPELAVSPVSETKVEQPITHQAQEPAPRAQGKKKYSAFPPLRLIQKIGTLGTIILDATVIVAVAKVLEQAQYLSWLASGKQVFTQSAKNLSAHAGKLTQNLKADNFNLKTTLLHSVKNEKLSKAISRYNPAHPQFASLPLSHKIIGHTRHTRPNWYKKYHSFPIVNYFHIAALVILMSALGFGIYKSVVLDAQEQEALAALPTAPPRILSFQGRLTDANANPITSATDLRFAIYNDDTSSGSALLWQETQYITPDGDGIFSVFLGSNTSFPSTLFAENSGLYLGITVEQDAELTPRQQLATVAYAANSETLQGLPPITAAGAGQSNVVLALDSSGDLTIGGTASPTFSATGGEFTLSGNVLNLTTTAGSDADVKIEPNGIGKIDILKPLQNTSLNNNVTTAAGAVEVNDLFAVLATSSGQSAFTLNQNGAGPLISASASGVAKFTVLNDGSGTFAGDLTVEGGDIVGANGTRIDMGEATSGDIEITGDLLPSFDAAYDLGSTSKSWKDVYLTGQLCFDDSDCATSWATVGTNYWQKNSGALSPLGITDDLLVGGTATSSAKWQVFATGTNAGTASSSGQLTFRGTTDPKINILNGENFGILTSSGGDAGLAERFTVLNNGNVGIGSTTPTAKLDVNGGIMTSTTGLCISSCGVQLSRSSNDAILNLTNAAAIRFGTNNTERVRIDSAGNVGIGTTNPLSNLHVGGSSTGANLQVASYTGLGTEFSSGATIIGNNVKADTSAGQMLIMTTHASLGARAIRMADEAGITFHTSDGSVTSGDVYSSERMRIDENGNVGIGTTNPGQNLHVIGNGRFGTYTGSFIGSSGVTDSIQVAGTDLTDVAGIILGVSDGTQNSRAWMAVDATNKQYLFDSTFSSGGALDYVFKHLGNALVTIKSGGNVGIGSTSPGYKLDVNGSTNTTSLYLGGTQVTSTATELNYLDGTTVTAGGVIYGNGTYLANTGAGTSGYVLKSNGSSAPTWVDPSTLSNSYWQRALGALSPSNITDDVLIGGTATASAKIRLGGITNADSFFNTGGNVGIGTTTPDRLLTAYFNNSNTATGIFNVRQDGTGDAGMNFSLGTSGVSYAIGIDNSDSDKLKIGYSATGPSGVDAGTRLTIDTSGNVGIGTTTTSNFKLTVGGSIGPSTDDTYDLGSSSFRWRDLYLGPASLHVGTDGNEAIIGYNTTNNYIQLDSDGNGTADFVLDDAGNVGIGTTSPLAKLDVAGAASVSGNLTLAGGTRQIQTTSNNSLTLGGDSTGNIILSPLNGSGAVLPTANNSVDLGTSAQQFKNLYVQNIYQDGNQVNLANYWQRALGAISPSNSSDDVLVGGTATASALIKLGGTTNATSFFNTGGNLGIGTSSPNSFIEISKSDSTTGLNPGESATRISLINRTGSPANTQSDIIFGADDATSDTKSVYAGITGYVTGSGSGGQIGDLILSTKGSVTATTLTERLRVSSTGNVGIGTTTPGARLDLGTGALKSTQSGVLEVYVENTGVRLKNIYTGGGWARGILTYEDSTGADYFQLGGYGSGQTFNYAYVGPAYNTAWQVWDDTGNVGIGSTSPTQKLDVGGSIAASGNIDINGTSNDIAGTLNLSGNTLTSSSTLSFVHATTGLSITTDGVITDIDDASVQIGEDLSVSGDLTLTGGDITGANGAAIDIGEVSSGNITFTGNMIIGDTSFLGLAASGGRLVFNAASTPDEIDVQDATLDLNANLLTNIGNAGTDFTSSGGLTLAGDLDVNGTSNDIAGTLNLSGGALTSTGDLTISPSGNNIIFSDTTTLQIGGASAVAYNAFSNSGGTPSNPNVTADNDLYIQGDLDIGGTIYLNGSQLTPGALVNYWQKNSGALSPTDITDDLLLGGTATSSAVWQVFATGTNAGTASSSGQLTFRGTTDPKINVLNGENFSIATSTGGDAGLADRLTVLNGGNVGVGTTSPIKNLQVHGSSNTRLLISEVTGVTNSTAELLFKTTSNVTDTYTKAGVIFQDDGSTSARGKLHLAVNTANDGSNVSYSDAKLTIDSTGNVGIGTTTPGSTLSVNGGVSIGSTYTGTAAPSNGLLVQGNVGIGTTTFVTTGPSASTIALPANGLITGGSPTGNLSAIQFTNNASTTAGYGVYTNFNAYWDGTNFRQPRGSLPSYLTTANNHLGWSWMYAAAGSSDDGTVTPTEVAALTNAGNFQIDGDLTISGGNVTNATTFDSTLTSTGTLTANAGLVANGSFTLGDNGDLGSINTSDWDISTTGALTGISGITTDGAYTQSGSSANTFSGATTISATGTALTLSGAATTAINISNTGVTTDISLQNGETIDNNTNGTIAINATNTDISGNLNVTDRITATDPSNYIVLGTADGYSQQWAIGQNSRNQMIFKDKDSNTTFTGTGGTVSITGLSNTVDGNEGTYATVTTTSTSDTAVAEITNTVNNLNGSVFSQAAWYPSITFRNTRYAQSITVEARYDGDGGSYQTIWSTTTNSQPVWQGTATVPTGIISPYKITALRITMTDWTTTGATYIPTIGLHHKSEEIFPQYANRLGATFYGTVNFTGVTSDITTATGEHLAIVPGGNVGIGTTSPSSFKLQVSGHVGPTTDSTYNLGSNAVRWANGYFDTLYGDGSNLTGITASSIAFSGITSGTNTTAAMVVGAGASLDYTSTGTINASSLAGSAESAFFKLADNETVTGTPAFNGGTTGASAPFTVDSTFLVTNLNADLFDGVNSDAFLRSDTSDNFTSGTLTLDSGTTLAVAGDLSIADTSIALTGASTTFASTGVLTLDSASYVRVGDTATPGQATGDDDLFVEGDLEVDGTIYDSSGNALTNYWSRTAGVLSPLNLNDALAATTSATTALTVTQTGAFNALLIQDQASDTTPFVIDQTGNVGVGTTTPGQELDVNGDILVAGGGTIDARAAGTLTIGGTTQTGLTLGRSGAATTLNGSSLTVGATSWTATPTISGLITATSGLTSTGTLTANGALTANGTFTLGDSGDAGSISTNDWAISTTGALSGITGIANDGGYTQSGSSANTFTGTTTFSGAIDSNGDLSIADTDIAFDGASTNFNVTGNFSLNTDDLFVNKTSGNVGIGTSTPVGLLNVRGAVTGKALVNINETGDQALFTASASGTTRFTIDNSGRTNIIGNDSTEFFGLTIKNSAAISNQLVSMAFRQGGNNNVDFAAIKNKQYAGANDGDLSFWTLDGGTLTQKMVITDTGNVGIGTTDPSAFKLQVTGNVGPTTDSTYDLGSNTVRWANGYFDTLYGDGSNLTGISASSMAFSGITTGTNTTATMTVGTGASLTYSGSGTINASSLAGSAESAFFKLADNETVTGVPAFNGGTTGASAPFSVDSTFLVTNLNADLFDGINSDAFLRSDTTDSFTSGTLTMGAGTTLLVSGDLSISDTAIAFNGASTDFVVQGALTINAATYVRIGDTSTPGQASGDDDLYVEGDLEVDGTIYDSSGNALTNYWTRTAGVLSPSNLNDAIAATTSATTAFTITQTGAFNALLIQDQASDTSPFVIDQSGNVGIGTTAPTANFVMDAVGRGRFSTGLSIGTTTTTNTLEISGTVNVAGTGDLTLAGDIAVNGGDITSTASTFNFLDNTTTKTIDLGGVTSSAADTINIATNGTSADTIAIGNNNVSTLLSLTGGDDWSITSTGILTLSASAAQTTALVITDTDYTNALSIGDNNITGTTANIDLTNFDVVGSSGNLTSAGSGAFTGVLQAGSTSTVAYSRLGTGTTGNGLNAADDLLVSGDLEVAGTLYFSGTIDTTLTQGSIVFAGASGALTQDNTNFFWDDTQNRLGIGTNSPAAPLTVTGSIQGSNFVDYDNTSYLLDPASTGTSLSVAGSIGVGVTSPTSKLHVTGAITGKALAIFDETGDQNILTASASGTTRFVISNAGNVGIGTITPGQELDVNGDILVAGGGTIDARAAGTLTIGGTTQTGLTLGRSGAATTINGSSLTVGATSWTATPTISGLITATSGLTSTGTLTANGALTANGTFTLGDSGDAGSVSTNDWAISTLGALTGISGITTDGAYTQTGTGLNAFSGNVGIGTTAPGAKLDVMGSSTARALIGDPGITNYVGISLNGTLSSTNYNFVSGPVDQDLYINRPTGYDINFNLNSSTTHMTIKDTGNVGIGTTTPDVKFHVQTAINGGYVMHVDNTSTGNTASGILVEINKLNSARNTGNYFVAFSGQGTVGGKIQGNAGISGVSYTTSGADFAEYFLFDQAQTKPQAGDIVSIVPNKQQTVSKATSMNGLVGVVSSSPAFVGNGPICAQDDMNCDSNYELTNVLVGLTGQVMTNVTTENGAIQPGDPLTLSSKPGIAKKATTSGPIIGKALQSYSNNDSNAVGQIKVLVQGGWYDPNIQIANSGDLNITESNGNFTAWVNNQPVEEKAAYADAAIARLKAGLVSTKQLIVDGPSTFIGQITASALNVTGSLQANVINAGSLAVNQVSIAGESLRDYIVRVVSEAGFTNTNEVTSPLGEFDNLATNVISPLGEDPIEIQGDVTIKKTASTSGNLTVGGDASVSGKLAADTLQATDATISGTLRAGKIVADDIEGLEAKIGSLAATTIINTTNVYNIASNSSTPEASSSAVEASTSASLISDAIYTDYADIASLSADLAYVPNLSSDFATFQQGLMAFGPSSLSDVSVAGQLSVNGSLIVADNSINVLGSTLEIQPLRQGNIAFMGGLVSIDIDGNMSVNGNATFAKDVTIKGTLAANVISPVPGENLLVKLPENQSFVIADASGSAKFQVDSKGNVAASGSAKFGKVASDIFNVIRGAQADTSLTETVASSSAGVAAINPGQFERTIVSPYVTEDSLIYITPTSDTNGLTPFVARQTADDPETEEVEGSFTIRIPQTTINKIEINWWIVN